MSSAVFVAMAAFVALLFAFGLVGLYHKVEVHQQANAYHAGR
ncbi:hypothetical protein [Motilimonas pumila]|nr:hypothetical protein [Motilimonas pumila]